MTKLLPAKERQQKRIALAVASPGIAATLLPGARMAHSTFKLPFNASDKADVLRRCQLIVCSECTISSTVRSCKMSTIGQPPQPNWYVSSFFVAIL